MSAFGGGEISGGQEGHVAYARRRKSGLETPLRGRMYGENKFLVFAPPLWYDILVAACVVGGALAAIYYLKEGESWQVFISLLVLGAGLWGAASNERMICQLGSKTYTRFEGQGFAKRILRGNLKELDALVLTAEQHISGTGFGAYVTFRLVLYWKGMRHPPLPIERQDRSVAFSAPLSAGAQDLLTKGAYFARALEIPYYDNSHLMGRSPVPTL